MHRILELTIPDFLAWLNHNVVYGLLTVDGKTYDLDHKSKWEPNYRLQIKDSLLRTRVGHCWDFVEVQRWFFQYKGIQHQTYFICDDELKFTHTFLIFSLGTSQTVYWFESAWFIYRGIQALKSKRDCLHQIKTLFQAHHQQRQVLLYQYPEPTAALTSQQFIDHCLAGQLNEKF